MMTEIQTIEGGQKNVLLRRANINKIGYTIQVGTLKAMVAMLPNGQIKFLEGKAKSNDKIA